MILFLVYLHCCFTNVTFHFSWQSFDWNLHLALGHALQFFWNCRFTLVHLKYVCDSTTIKVCNHTFWSLFCSVPYCTVVALTPSCMCTVFLAMRLELLHMDLGYTFIESLLGSSFTTLQWNLDVTANLSGFVTTSSEVLLYMFLVFQLHCCCTSTTLQLTWQSFRLWNWNLQLSLEYALILIPVQRQDRQYALNIWMWLHDCQSL